MAGVSRDGGVIALWTVGNQQDSLILGRTLEVPLLDPPEGFSRRLVSGITSRGGMLVGVLEDAETLLRSPYRLDLRSGVDDVVEPYVGIAGFEIPAFPSVLGVSGDGSTLIGDVDGFRDPEPFAGPRAYRLRSDEIEFLEDFGSGSLFSTATAVDEDGSVIGGTLELSSGHPQAVIWDDEGRHLLGGSAVTVVAISADGSRAAGYGSEIIDPETFSRRRFPYYWTRETGVREIRALLPSLYDLHVDPTFDLDVMRGMSDDGLVFVGYGKREGERSRPWILRLDRPIEIALPEPRVGLQLIIGIVALRLVAAPALGSLAFTPWVARIASPLRRVRPYPAGRHPSVEDAR